MNGAYYFYYKASEKENALDTFRQLLVNAEVDAKDAVVLCRSVDWVADWSGEGGGQGQGVVRHFVDAVVARDQLSRLETAYNCLCRGIVGLLADEHEDLCDRLMAVGRIEERKLRQAIFAFLRDEANGLPSGKLVANGEWHEEMSRRVKAFIPKLCVEYGLKAATTIGQRLANKDLDANPLVPIRDLAQADATPLRFSTVHRVKGESIGGVMYVVSKQHLKALLEGPSSELGRIGYVALTRAKNLFVLAVPDYCQNEFEEALAGLGFHKPGGGAITAVKVVAGDGSSASGGG